MNSGVVDDPPSPSTEAATPTAPERTVSCYIIYGLLLLVIVFFAMVRWRLRDIPLERDEGEFAYGGQLISQGVPLYSLIYTLKLPGTYAAYAVILGVFGQSAAGIHTGLILVNAITTLLVFALGWRLFGALAGLVAAASYAALSTSPSVVGFAGHATHFVVLFAVGGVWLLLEAMGKKQGWLFFASGALFGVGFLMKQPGLFFLVWAAVYLLWQKLLSTQVSGQKKAANPSTSSGQALEHQRQSVTWKEWLRQEALLGIGFALPFAVTCLIEWRAGTFQGFWFWTFSYANRYGSNAGVWYGLEQLRTNAADVIGPVVGIWLLAALGAVAFLWSARVRSRAFFLLSFLVFSFLAVSPGLYFRNHYFILMLPAVAILAGVAIGSAVDTLLRRTRSRAFSAIPVLLFVIAFSAATYRQRDYLFHLDPIAAARQVYGQNPFPQALEISRYISANTHEGATIAVLGCEPQIYFYSGRHSATGHSCAYPLLEPTYGVTLQKQMVAEIERSRPEMIVLVNDPTSWIAFPKTASPDEIMGWANEYMKQYYVLDGVAEIDQYSTSYYWGERARKHPISMPDNIVVMKRKAE